MPTKTETVVKNLKINYLSNELFAEALANGELEQNEVYMTPDADIQLPTKVSELENDSGFITSTDIANKLDKNGNGSNVTVSFTTASSRTNISSGESMATIASKASKYFTDLKGVSFTGSYNDLINKPSNATTTSDGFQSSSDKLKLDGIEAGANKYIHPTYTAYSTGVYKFEVDGEGHIISASLIEKADITGLGIPGQDTTYELATTTTSGLMSPEDKTKLDGIEYATEADILALFA